MRTRWSQRRCARRSPRCRQQPRHQRDHPAGKHGAVEGRRKRAFDRVAAEFKKRIGDPRFENVGMRKDGPDRPGSSDVGGKHQRPQSKDLHQHGKSAMMQQRQHRRQRVLGEELLSAISSVCCGETLSSSEAALNEAGSLGLSTCCAQDGSSPAQTFGWRSVPRIGCTKPESRERAPPWRLEQSPPKEDAHAKCRFRLVDCQPVAGLG